MNRHTRSTRSSLLQSTTVKLLIIATNAATGIVCARALRSHGRGELAAMMLWNVFLANACTFGVPSALTYQSRRWPERRSELVGAALCLGFVASVLAMGIGYVGMSHWLPQYSSRVIFFSCLFLWNIPIFTCSLIGRAATESIYDFNTSNLSLTLAPILTLLGLGMLVATHSFTPVGAAWVYVAMGVPSFALIMKRVFVSLRPSVTRFSESCQLLLSYGIRSYGIDLCGTMAFYVDQALVIHLLPPSVMGAYVVALSLARMLNAFHSAVVMVLFPRIASESPSVIIDLTGQAARVSTLITAASGMFIIALGPKVVGLLYGREYMGASSTVQVLVVEVMLSGLAQVLCQAFMALARPGVVTAFQVFGLSLTVPLMLVLIPRFGVVGAASALLLSTTVRLGLVLMSFRRLLNVPCPRIVAGRSDVRKLVAVLRTAIQRPRTQIVESTV